MSSPEFKMPAEGMSTISAQFTLKAVAKMVSAIRTLRDKKLPEEEIRRKIERELKYFDAHSRDRIYQKSFGERIDDDFSADEVVKREVPKENTLVLTLKTAVAEIGEESLVQFEGIDYVVAEAKGTRYTLKKIL